MNQEFIGALKEIVKDKGISEDLLFTTIEDALVAAYKKNYAGPTSSAQNVKVQLIGKQVKYMFTLKRL